MPELLGRPETSESLCNAATSASETVSKQIQNKQRRCYDNGNDD